MVSDSDNGNVVSGIDPAKVRRIHLVGVAGTGMGSFAGMLKAAGYQVSGSDENVYPPMGPLLIKPAEMMLFYTGADITGFR